MNKGNSFLFGLIVGGVIGGFTILLSTPKSGVELRSSIKDSSRDLTYKLKHLKTEAKDFLQLVEQSTKEGKVVVKDFAEDVQKTINVWKKEIEPHQVNIQHEIEEIEETLLKLEEAFKNNQPTT